MSHLILDLLTHGHDIVLLPGLASPKLGLGLYDAAPFVAFLVELIYGIFCWRVYQGSRGLLALIVVGNLANLSFLSPPRVLPRRPPATSGDSHIRADRRQLGASRSSRAPERVQVVQNNAPRPTDINRECGMTPETSRSWAEVNRGGVVITGATGQVGRETIDALLRHGIKPTALVRGSEQFEGCITISDCLNSDSALYAIVAPFRYVRADERIRR
jgi:hypothetical protein